MKKITLLLASLAFTTVAVAESPAPRTDRVLTQEEQQGLTPNQVIERLSSGNSRFVNGELTTRNHSSLVRDAAAGQAPKAMILSCVDSRVPVEDIFDQGIGDIFVARVAGNIENTDILGSIEFATKVSGAKLIVVLGHESCGAIRAAIDNVQLGNITALLENIKPAVEALSDYPGEQTSSNPEFVHLVAEKNVELTIENILEKSPIVAEMVESGEVSIVGGVYDLHSGEVEILD
ncbi:Carbonic anhydrase 2 [Halioglobus japonicus]|nr:Carbonic anhydrase 2 [Halioglobus japonicus]